MKEYESIVLEFVNGREHTRITSPVYTSGNLAEEMRAMNEAWSLANSKGLTHKEFKRLHRKRIPVPSLPTTTNPY